jgi:glutamate decarboxylase
MIKDDLTLDGTPTLNLASFVTTYMVRSHSSQAFAASADGWTGRGSRKAYGVCPIKPHPSIIRITVPYSDAFSKNFIDYEEYPVSADIQNRAYTIHVGRNWE